ncbi:major facilitator superfamily protein [Salinarchaeum sp. Harcht-Bsk1]|uniref:MFS transporter n=1 Tax=Salinarchaeum sp. Harcht-Bsk1 TaxID=1333523 RepID=UPI000342302B|nr:MFS transporter [Salinarchaeum sp. Harcht-Bsk1]AGN00984.1 major facilitator superfamily protein [Salinarchaeum sp. Harcht-Bsk1]
MVSEERGFKLFYFILFASFSGYVMFRNVFLDEIGLTGTQMGIVGFLFPLCGMIAQPIWGLIADWKGASKPILYVSTIVAALAALLYPLAPFVGATFAAVLVATVVFATFRAPAVPIANALVLSSGMSYEGVRAYGSIAFGLAGLGFGFLIGITATEAVFYAYTVGTLLLALLLTRLPADDPEALGDDLDLESIRRLLSRQFFLLLGAAFFLGVMTPATAAFFSVYVRAIDQPDTITGFAWFIKTVAEAVAFVYVARRGGGSYRWLMAAAGVFYMSTYLLLATTGSIVVVVSSQVMLGLGYALFNLASVNLAHSISPAALKSTAQSLLMVGGVSAGRAIGELVTGVLVDAVGVQAMYGYVAVLGVLVVAFSLAISASTAADAERQAAAEG